MGVINLLNRITHTRAKCYDTQPHIYFSTETLSNNTLLIFYYYFAVMVDAGRSAIDLELIDMPGGFEQYIAARASWW